MDPRNAGIEFAKLGGLVLLAALAVKLLESFIDKVFSKKWGTRGFADQRGKTLSGLLKSAIRYVTGIILLLTVLEMLGIDTKALLGGAAVLGVAVGFGAQNLVRDVISGFFIIYERQYDVGDYVTIAGVSGFVEEIGLRTTRLRDFSGDLHIVPNGLVDKTTNSSRRESRALVEIRIAYEEDTRKAIEVLSRACQEFGRQNSSVADGPKVLGVNGMDDFGVVILVWAKTVPLEHWQVERDLRLYLKEALEREGMHVSYPRRVVLNDVPGGKEDS